MRQAFVKGSFSFEKAQGDAIIRFSMDERGKIVALVSFFIGEEELEKFEIPIDTNGDCNDDVIKGLMRGGGPDFLDAAELALKKIADGKPGLQANVSYIQDEWEKWDVQDLIARFENNIIYDAHGFYARFERSFAQRELYRRGQEVLKPIIEHLRKKPPSDFMDLNIAWAHLLNHIEIKIDPKKSGPKDLRNTEGWIEWAEKFAA